MSKLVKYPRRRFLWQPQFWGFFFYWLQKGNTLFARIGVVVLAVFVSVGFTAAGSTNTHPPHATRPTAASRFQEAPGASIASPELTSAAAKETLNKEILARTILANTIRTREAAAAAARARQHTYSHSSSSSGGTVTGSCAAMKPAGFPDYIIQRESGGDPNITNSSGAMGCAQILSSHFSSDCAGMDYTTCWKHLYELHGLQPWACTPESGCG